MKQLLLIACLVATTASAGVIEVSGSASVVSEPTQAVLSASIASEAKTAKEAKAGADQVVKRVLTAFKEADVDPRAYKAGHLQLGPKYNYRSEQRELVGYQAQRQLELIVDVNQVGVWLERFTELGINQVSSPQYQVELTQQQTDSLMQTALANALHKAKVLADATQQEVGDVVEIVEQGGSPSPRMYKAAMMDTESYHAGTVSEQVNLRVKIELN